MSEREFTASSTPGTPLTRRQLRELEEAQRALAVRSASASSRRRPPVKPTRAPKVRADRHGGRRFLSLSAMLFAAAILIGMSVPANAFFSDASALGPVTQKTELPGQSVSVSEDAVAQGVTRDTYEVTSYAERLRAQYGNAGRFTATTGAIRWPFPYSVPTTDGFGPRPVWVSGTPFHNGVDFTPGSGTPIYAIADGVVSVHADEPGGFGNHVIIQHNLPGGSIESLYAHMQVNSSPLQPGDVIKVGDFIGLVGDTGNSYGAHLHFELHIDKVPVDPYAWLTANAVN